jgi:hypothetical protein
VVPTWDRAVTTAAMDATTGGTASTARPTTSPIMGLAKAAVVRTMSRRMRPLLRRRTPRRRAVASIRAWAARSVRGSNSSSNLPRPRLPRQQRLPQHRRTMTAAVAVVAVAGVIATKA